MSLPWLRNQWPFLPRWLDKNPSGFQLLQFYNRLLLDALLFIPLMRARLQNCLNHSTPIRSDPVLHCLPPWTLPVLLVVYPGSLMDCIFAMSGSRWDIWKCIIEHGELFGRGQEGLWISTFISIRMPNQQVGRSSTSGHSAPRLNHNLYTFEYVP